MTIRVDSARNEIRALLNMVDFGGQKVLEIGCGDGRLTWRYAAIAAHVTAIDAFEGAIKRAKADIPEELKSIVEFQHIAFEDFAAASEPASFDIAILAWSLCWMEHKGMVHALEEIQRLLKPDGVLINILPYPEGESIKVFQGGQVLYSKPKCDSDSEDMLAADEAVAEVVARGLYRIERSDEFEYLTYGSSVDELRAYWERYEAYNDNFKEKEALLEELYAQVEEIMRSAGAGAEVATYERTGMARLRAVGD